MSRIGIFTLPHFGHLYPATALGRKLAAHGHEVVFFGYISTKGIIRKAGLLFHPLPVREEYLSPRSRWLNKDLSASLQGLQFSTRTVLAEAPEAIRAAGIDGLVVDQMDFAAGTVAELLKIPFVSLSLVPPICIHPEAPPVCFGWKYREGIIARMRNRFGNALFNIYMAPVVAMINRQRRAWGLPLFRNVNDVISPLALITQLPRAMDFPHYDFLPQLHYTGPFHDGDGRRHVSFPWERLDGRPLIYASMGTRRNEDQGVFRMIAEACDGIDAQLVISLGGRLEEPGPLAGNPIVVQYAPQLDILSTASLTITHAGINTTLESLSKGVPLVAIPVGDDQPGVAARIEAIGAGKAVPYKKLSAKQLRNAIGEVLHNPKYRTTAQRMGRTIERLNGLEQAVDVIESTFKQAKSLSN